MKAIVTVGLGFGDEGKGATVDHLCRRHSADLVVRYSGGAQAGHNVELSDGRRHTFSQFGAGTFAGAQTYLGSRVIVNPATLTAEERHLVALGVELPRRLLTVHPQCLIATTYHTMMNRIRELARGQDRHGSCGLGIGETRHYWLRHGRDAVVAGDLLQRQELIEKLTVLKDRFLMELQHVSSVESELAELIYETSPYEEADMLISALDAIGQSVEMPKSKLAIFEGSQGVLLDEYFGFHPFTTWSTVTPKHAIEMLDDAGVTDYRVLGLTRSYTTRHGAGPFPTRCDELSASLIDHGNPDNDWQGSLEAGPLDLVLLRYAARIARIDALVVNHLDQYPGTLCRRYEDVVPSVPRSIQAQAELARRLFRCRPVIERATKSELLNDLGEIAPIEWVGVGAQQRRKPNRMSESTVVQLGP